MAERNESASEQDATEPSEAVSERASEEEPHVGDEAPTGESDSAADDGDRTGHDSDGVSHDSDGVGHDSDGAGDGGGEDESSAIKASDAKDSAGADEERDDNEDAAKEAEPPRKRRWVRWLGITTAIGVVLGILLWIGVHRIPWLGPAIADGLRSIIGVEGVTKLEDFAYGVEDRFNRLFRKSEAPKAYWEVPTTSPTPAPLPVASAEGCTVPPFRPADLGPVHKSWSAPGDGTWVPIVDARRPKEAPRLYKTLLHPDKNRSWAAVTVVAIDRRTVDLHMVAGRYEPKAETKEAQKLERPALIAEAHHKSLLAAFNGGFKAQHGHYGMRVDDITIIRPRARACWVANMPKNELVIGDWERLAEREPDALWWRQTPACMVEAGKLHPGLVSEKNTLWGATLDRNTVIRRSAIGISQDGKTLYSGIGDSTTAPAMARAMLHAGAVHVAQLDVNWSYPKFVVFKPKSDSDPTLMAHKIADGFEFSEDEYIRKRAPRDFFYLTRKGDEVIEKIVCGPEEEPPATEPASSASAVPSASNAPSASAKPQPSAASPSP